MKTAINYVESLKLLTFTPGGTMKKTATGFAFAAAIGLSVVSAAPAMALTPTGQFENCTEAANNGVFNIPSTDPRYGAHLDSDLDGVGCEDADAAAPVTPSVPVAVDPNAPVAVAAPAPQVQMPVGAPATGVTQQSSDDSFGAFYAAGGLLLVVAGASVAARRKQSNA